jgi:hypothetical protein
MALWLGRHLPAGFRPVIIMFAALSGPRDIALRHECTAMQRNPAGSVD